MSALDSVKQAYEAVQTLRKASENIKTAELSLAIADLTHQLADLKMEIIQLNEDNQALREQIKVLSEPPSMEFRDGAYYDGEDGPYCPGCFDSNGKKIRLGEMPTHAMGTFGRYRCHVCKAHIK